ncbi:MAG: FAD binding domain-containing protein [Stellaceae bacterium]
MEFFHPTNLPEALSLLSEHEGAQCLAGGATLVAMMNAGLVEPSALISLTGLSELAGIARLPDGSVRIGAMTRHAETARSTIFHAGQRVLSEAAGKIANPPVRNMGTIGGSLAFADPAADYLPALACLDAMIEVAGRDGARTLAIADFVLDWYATALGPEDIITGIVVPPSPAGSVGVFEKLERTAGDFAIASVALVLAVEEGVCRVARIAIGGCAPAPIRRREAEALIEGTRFEAAAVRAAGGILAEAADPVDDVRASADYRRRVIPRLLAKTVARARAALGADT